MRTAFWIAALSSTRSTRNNSSKSGDDSRLRSIIHIVTDAKRVELSFAVIVPYATFDELMYLFSSFKRV